MLFGSYRAAYGLCTRHGALTKQSIGAVNVSINGFRHRALNTSAQEPLRILFCGSEEYSIACLEALHSEIKESESNIASIDVVCRPGKRFGRGLKNIRHPPIRDVAQQLGLQLHEIDTFTGWNLPSFHSTPSTINLIVAVSFGLFVPPRLLKSAKYGGINVHPSMLPDFRGAAPLQWTLIAGDATTGATVQTLDHQKFDHGAILKQTDPPGLRIPPYATYEDLLKLVKPESARLLLDVIKARSFEDKGDLPVKQSTSEPCTSNLRLAPKIKPEHRRVDWRQWSADDILRRQTALGRLWNFCSPMADNDQNTDAVQDTSKRQTRIILGDDLSLVDSEYFKDHYPESPALDVPIGIPYSITSDAKVHYWGTGLYVNTSDGKQLYMSTLKVEGYKPSSAFEAGMNHGFMKLQHVCPDYTLHMFQHALD